MQDRGFVLGYGGYLREKGLLNRYIRYDTMTIAMQYMGMAMAGLPYMGVGGNLAYKRSIFFENKGFGPYINLQSGDDDLFINKLANGSNCSVVKSQNAFTRSIPASSFAALSKQKTRHLSTAVHYTPWEARFPRPGAVSAISHGGGSGLNRRGHASWAASSTSRTCSRMSCGLYGLFRKPWTRSAIASSALLAKNVMPTMTGTFSSRARISASN